MNLPNRIRHRSLIVISGLLVLSLIAGCLSSHTASPSTVRTEATTTTADHAAGAAPTQADPKAVLEAYFHALDAAQFDAAYALWRSQSAQAPASAADLKSRYENITSIRIEVTGETRSEGAAGTIYTTVPVTLNERTRTGAEQSQTGHCVLARTNDVPGSSKQARQWHLHSCDLS